MALVLALTLAVPATAKAREFGKWRVSVKASIGHDWKLTSTVPCDVNGRGSVTADMKGRSKVFRISYYARGGFKYWSLGSRAIRLRGEVTAVDNTRVNPDKFGESCGRVDTAGCVTRTLDRSTAGYVDGMNTRRKPGVTFDVANLMIPLRELPRECELGDLRDFSRFPGAPRKEFGRMIVRMPRASKLRRRRAFTLTARHRGATHERYGTTSTRRQVRLRFRPAS